MQGVYISVDCIIINFKLECWGNVNPSIQYHFLFFDYADAGEETHPCNKAANLEAYIT